MGILKRNLEALLNINPLLAAKIFEIQHNELFEVYVDKDPANINIISKHHLKPIYSGKPIDETEASYKELTPYQRYPYLYFFGFGNGILYKMLLNNSVHQRIVIFEPEVEVIYIVLSLIDFTKEIEERRLSIQLPVDLSLDMLVNTLFNGTAKLYAKVYDMLVPFNYYYEQYNAEIVAVNNLVIESLTHLAYSMGNDVIDSLIGVEHHIQNLPTMIDGPSLLEASKKATNTPIAVVVSTGPSLAKQLPLLKKYQKYVTILSVDASFPILSEYGIVPDFVFSLERVARTSIFYKRTPKKAFKKVNFLLSSVSHKELVNSIVDGTLVINMRPFGYLKSFHNDPWGYIGSGMSSANMAYEFAVASRFENVVLIGQDLAYGNDGLSHSSGHVFGNDEIKAKKTDLSVVAYGGEGMVETTLVWNMFKNFYEIAIAQANSANRTVTYNSTEGGARIEGAIEAPFKDVLKKLVDKSAKKESIKLQVSEEEAKRSAIDSACMNLKNYFEKGEAVKSECERIFLKVMEFLESIEELNKSDQLDLIDFDQLLNVNEEIDGLKMVFEEEDFDLMFGTILMPLILHQEIELATIMVRYSDGDTEKKAKLIEWIYAHKFWLFSMAGAVQNVLDTIGRAVLTWDKNHDAAFDEIIELVEQYAITRGGLEKRHEEPLSEL